MSSKLQQGRVVCGGLIGAGLDTIISLNDSNGAARVSSMALRMAEGFYKPVQRHLRFWVVENHLANPPCAIEEEAARGDEWQARHFAKQCRKRLLAAFFGSILSLTRKIDRGSWPGLAQEQGSADRELMDPSTSVLGPRPVSSHRCFAKNIGL